MRILPQRTLVLHPALVKGEGLPAHGTGAGRPIPWGTSVAPAETDGTCVFEIWRQHDHPQVHYALIVVRRRALRACTVPKRNRPGRTQGLPSRGPTPMSLKPPGREARETRSAYRAISPPGRRTAVRAAARDAGAQAGWAAHPTTTPGPRRPGPAPRRPPAGRKDQARGAGPPCPQAAPIRKGASATLTRSGDSAYPPPDDQHLRLATWANDEALPLAIMHTATALTPPTS